MKGEERLFNHQNSWRANFSAVIQLKFIPCSMCYKRCYIKDSNAAFYNLNMYST